VPRALLATKVILVPQAALPFVREGPRVEGRSLVVPARALPAPVRVPRVPLAAVLRYVGVVPQVGRRALLAGAPVQEVRSAARLLAGRSAPVARAPVRALPSSARQRVARCP
jgi:hypothetical protein